MPYFKYHCNECNCYSYVNYPNHNDVGHFVCPVCDGSMLSFNKAEFDQIKALRKKRIKALVNELSGLLIGESIID